VKLQNSSSDFSVYSTNGEQLSGDLAGFNELAHQLDKKRIVFYIRASPEAILLGTRLIVRIIGGREERAVFIKRYAVDGFFAKGDFVNRFYDEAKAQVENLEQIHYQVLGLLTGDDLPVREKSVALSSLLAITGKVLIHEPVKIKTGDLSISFGALRTIMGSFTRKKIPTYTIAIAQYSFDEDILISSNNAGMDLEIPENGQDILQPLFKKSECLFGAIAEIYDRERDTFRKTDCNDKESFSRILKSRLIDSDILDDMIRRDPEGTKEILDLFRNDPGLLSRIVRKIFRSKKTLSGIDREFITLIASHITGSAEIPGPDDIELLKASYPYGDDELQHTIRQFLVSRGKFEEFFLKDLVNSSIRTGNNELLQSVVTNPACTARDLRIITGGVDFSHLEPDLVLAVIENMFESDFDRDPKGQSIYRAMVKEFRDRQFNVKKLNQVQGQYDRALDPEPQPVSMKTVLDAGNKKILIAILVLLIALAGIFFLGFGGIPGSGPGANQTIDPATNQSVNPAVDLIPAGPVNLTATDTFPVTFSPGINPVLVIQNASGNPLPETMVLENRT